MTLKQHLIDPEICIRCNTCEETCPVDAITHDDNNYVVNAELCNFCMDCIMPCPTGSIDNWRQVSTAYSLDDQYSWQDLPEQIELAVSDADDDVESLFAKAHEGAGGKATAPASALKPKINLFNRGKPITATITGNFRLTDVKADNDVRHLILDFGDVPFPFLEGQSIGIVAPNTDKIRLYSIASPRHGEKPNTNNLALTIKREPKGVVSNYMCDLKKGDKVQVTGPFGATYLMPNDSDTNLIMICTGTGSAPFRGFTEWRRRMQADAKGKMHLFFGARTPQELPYFGPLMKTPESLLTKHFAFSRLLNQPKVYVQDKMREEAAMLSKLVTDPKTYIYICGLKGMEQGVDAAMDDICRHHSLQWRDLRNKMREEGRYHVETY
jgi:benzoyl-CoA 2,3-epoxidase subunit A